MSLFNNVKNIAADIAEDRLYCRLSDEIGRRPPRMGIGRSPFSRRGISGEGTLAITSLTLALRFIGTA